MTTIEEYHKQLKDYENERDNDPELKEKKLQIEKLVNELNILKDSYDRKHVGIMESHMKTDATFSDIDDFFVCYLCKRLFVFECSNIVDYPHSFCKNCVDNAERFTNTIVVKTYKILFEQRDKSTSQN